MPVDPYAPTPLHNAALPPVLVCPHCGKQLPPIAPPAAGNEGLVSKAPGRYAETVRIERPPGNDAPRR
jgi:hypothetical protein